MGSPVVGPVPGRSRLERVAVRVGRILGRLDYAAERVRPWMVLAPLVAGTWVVMGVIASIAQHAGAIYYHGGDGTWYYTTAWMLGHGHIPPASIGYGYPLLIAPIVAIGGSSMLAGMPLVIAFNAIVLAPIALLCVYGLMRAFAGRKVAYVVSLLWVVLPLLAIRDFYPKYHGRYITQTLPAVTGLTPLGDYPTMVLLLVAAYFTFRAISAPTTFDVTMAGLAVGFALAVKPANAIFLPAPVIALLVARRPRAVLVFAGALVPSLIGLALWKYRGLGHIPVFHSPSATLASGGASAPPLGALHIGRYLDFNWDRLQGNIDGIREFTWSRRLLEWLILAGFIGLIRRSVAGAVLIGGWFASYLLLKGSTPVADINGGGFFRYLSPAFPAVFLLAASVPFLVPVWGRRMAGHRDSSGWPATARSRTWLLRVAGMLTLLPILLLLVLPQQSGSSAVRVPLSDLFVPADQFPLSATTRGGEVVLAWPAAAKHGATVAYGVLITGRDCVRPTHGAMDCAVDDETALGVTRKTSWVDHRAPGHFQYQVGVLVSPLGQPASGDYILVSRIATVDVR